MQKLIILFEPQCIHNLKNTHKVFNNATVKVYLKNLHYTYVTVTEYDLDSNSENMKTP